MIYSYHSIVSAFKQQTISPFVWCSIVFVELRLTSVIMIQLIGIVIWLCSLNYQIMKFCIEIWGWGEIVIENYSKLEKSSLCRGYFHRPLPPTLISAWLNIWLATTFCYLILKVLTKKLEPQPDIHIVINKRLYCYVSEHRNRVCWW